MERVTAMLTRQAGDVLEESAGTAYHNQRAIYAQRVIASTPPQSAVAAGPIIVMGVNVIAATTYDETTLTATCTIADIDLQSQIMTFWNRLAGIDTPAP
jgi:hypothetical protein